MESRQNAPAVMRDGELASPEDVRNRKEGDWEARSAFKNSDADGADALDGDPDWLDGESEADGQPLGADHLWAGDTGTLPQDARSSLLRLVKGPYVSESNDPAHWRALLNHTEAIRSRLADLFLELIIDAETGVAFAKNVNVEGGDFPKAATSYTLTLLDTIMVLLLRKELQTAGGARVFIGQTELFLQMNQYRDISKLDQAAYLKRLEASWSRLEKQRLLVRSDVEGRYEISPVLKLVFGAEEAQAVFDEYESMREQLHERGLGEAVVSGHADTVRHVGDTDAPADTGTLFDGLL